MTASIKTTYPRALVRTRYSYDTRYTAQPADVLLLLLLLRDDQLPQRLASCLPTRQVALSARLS